MMKTKNAVLFLAITLSYFVTASSPTSLSFISYTEAKTKLGDLSKFKKLALATNELVQKGKLPEAKASIKDLELTWDEAEAGIKPRASADWHILDTAIDHALNSLRESKPSLADCKNSMNKLIATFNTLEK